MKKLLAVLVALSMVLSMGIMAFAEYNGTKSPSDIATEEEWEKAVNLSSMELEDYANFWQFIDMRTTISEQGIYVDENDELMDWSAAWESYYAYILGNVTSDPTGAITEIVATVSNGDVEAGDAISMIGNIAMGGIGGDGESGDLSGVIDGILGGILPGEEDPAVTAEEYAQEIIDMINGGAEVADITAKIGEDLASGYIVPSQIPDIIEAISNSDAIDPSQNEKVQEILSFLEGLGGGIGGIELPDFGDVSLPIDIGNSEGGSFLDTILGIIGSIGDIFNPGGDEPNGDEPTNPGPGFDEDNTIPDTGDVSIVAVAAVAAVAGAAFVLTRKKSDDAE